MSDEQQQMDSDGSTSGTTIGPEEQAREVVEALANNNHEQILSQFSDNLITGFTEDIPPTFEVYLKPEPEPVLNEHWLALTALYGEFKGILAIESQQDDEATSLTVILEFQEQTHPLQLTITPEEQLSDLTFATGYEPPAYVDTSQFEERDVTIATDDVELGGTLTVPANSTNVPGVVLVHGSGGSDRDFTTGANKFLKDLAWGLADHGIASIRYDKRNFVTDVPPDEFDIQSVVIDDAVTAVDRLGAVEEVDTERRFVVGHSLGGTSATYIADQHTEVAGIVNLDGPAFGSAADLFLPAVQERWEQQDDISEYGNEQVRQMEKLAERIEAGEIEPDETTVLGQSGAWIQSYNNYAKGWLDTTASLTIPRFILVTGRDRPNQAAQWEETLRTELDDSNTDVAFYEDVNHYFQQGDIPSSPLEPLKFRKPPTETVVSDIAEWISDTPKKS